jgi:hypothetical protein
LVVSFGEPVRATTVSDTEVAEAIADGRALRIATSRDGFGGGDVRFYLLAPGEAVEGRGMNSGEYWDSWIFPRPCRLTDSILAVLDRNLWESESDVVCPLVQRGCANSTPFRPVVEPLEPIAPAIPVPDRPVAPPRPLPAPERAPPLGPEDVRLVRAIMAGDAAAVSAQLQQGYDPNHELKVDGIVRLSVPVLYLAVATCQTAIVRLLVERGANPNSYMTYRTHLEHRLCPCWRAARDPGLRSFLLAHGGDPRAEAREGEDTSYAVARVDNDEPFELLSCALGLPAFPKNEMG